MAENTCEYCGSTISRHKKYCDKQCYGNDISNTVTVECEYCEEKIEHNPSKERKYCSRECFGLDTRNSSTLSCDECGETITKQQNQIDKSNNLYCSQECNIESQRNNKIECEYCDSEFRPNVSDRKYCSRQCSAKDRQNETTTNCAYCNEIISRNPSYVEKYDNTFCSTMCLSEWMSENSLFATNNPNEKDGRYGGFGNNWIEWRDKIRNRAQQSCENCGKTARENGRRLSVHHIEPRSEFINDEDRAVEESNNWSNLVALCRSCHMKAEHGSITVSHNV